MLCRLRENVKGDGFENQVFRFILRGEVILGDMLCMRGIMMILDLD